MYLWKDRAETTKNVLIAAFVLLAVDVSSFDSKSSSSSKSSTFVEGFSTSALNDVSTVVALLVISFRPCCCCWVGVFGLCGCKQWWRNSSRKQTAKNPRHMITSANGIGVSMCLCSIPINDKISISIYQHFTKSFWWLFHFAKKLQKQL